MSVNLNGFRPFSDVLFETRYSSSSHREMLEAATQFVSVDGPSRRADLLLQFTSLSDHVARLVYIEEAHILLHKYIHINGEDHTVAFPGAREHYQRLLYRRVQNLPPYPRAKVCNK